MSTYTTLEINRKRLETEIKQSINAGIKYKLGAKASPLSKSWESIKAIDCSGFVRKFIHDLCDYDIGDGSYIQRGNISKAGFKPTFYYNCNLNDNRLRIAFMNPVLGKSGHVWLIINGKTLESFGGHGPGRRDWDEGILKRAVDFCFVLTEPVI